MAEAKESASAEELRLFEFSEELFSFEEPPLLPVFALTVPASSTTKAIALLNEFHPLSVPLSHSERALFPKAAEEAPRAELQRAVGVYVPPWRCRLSLQHLKRCRSVRSPLETRSTQAVLLLGESPDLAPQVREFLSALGEDGTASVSNSFASAELFEEAARAGREALQSVLEVLQKNAGDLGKACAEAAAALSSSAAQTAFAEHLRRGGVQGVLWSKALFRQTPREEVGGGGAKNQEGSRGASLLILLVPAIPPAQPSQQQPWSRVWPCFFNRKRAAAFGESGIQAASSSPTFFTEAEGSPLNASERNAALLPLRLSPSQRTLHLQLLERARLAAAAEKGAVSCCLLVFHTCEEAGLRSSEGDSRPSSVVTPGGEKAPCGCAVLAQVKGLSCAASAGTCVRESVSSSCFSSSRWGHPLRHPAVVAVGLVGKKLLDAQRQNGGEAGEAPPQLTRGNYLCTEVAVYCSEEPCVMCAMALLHSRVSAVFFLLDEEAPPSDMGGFTTARLNIDRRLNHSFRAFALRCEKKAVAASQPESGDAGDVKDAAF